jgi:hypothetical protein
MVSHTEGGTQTEGVRERVLRKIAGTMANLVTGELRRILNEELYNRGGEDYITDSSMICTHKISNQEG